VQLASTETTPLVKFDIHFEYCEYAVSGFAETGSGFNGQSVTDRSIYCITIEYEVGYCEFVYAVSAIFLLPFPAYALVGHRLSPFWGDRYK